MKFGRYLVVLVWSWLLGAAAVVGFTVLVDPIGISPVRIAIAGFNTLKPLQQDYDWIVKRYDVGRNQPTTVFMGSSRIKQSVDSQTVRRDSVCSSLQWRAERERKFSGNQGLSSRLSQGRQEFASCLHRGIRDGATGSAPIGPFVRSADGEHEPTDCPRIWTPVRYSGHGVGILLHERSELCYSHCCCQSRTGQRAHSRLI